MWCCILLYLALVCNIIFGTLIHIVTRSYSSFIFAWLIFLNLRSLSFLLDNILQGHKIKRYRKVYNKMPPPALHLQTFFSLQSKQFLCLCPCFVFIFLGNFLEIGDSKTLSGLEAADAQRACGYLGQEA